MKSQSIRDQAFSLRRRGYSYSYIAEKLRLSKSILSDWLSAIPYRPNREMLLKMGKARTASGLVKHKLKLRSVFEAQVCAKKDIGSLTKRDVFMFGIGLYLGEGTKTHDIVRISNSDPLVIRFAVRWFREVCGLRISNFRLRLHLYPDSDESKAIEYWSRITRIPKGQFQQTQIDFRKDKTPFRMSKLPHGTAHLAIVSGGKKEFGVFLARRINGWIAEVLK